MNKKKLIVFVCIIIVLCGSAFAFASCAKQELYIDTSELEVKTFDNYYVGLNAYDGGNTFDLSMPFENSTFSLKADTECASLNGSILTLYKIGTFSVEMTKDGKDVDKNIIVIDGVNVIGFNQFEFTLENKHKNAILHSEIVFPDHTIDEGHNITLSANIGIYGNGNFINAEGITKVVGKKDWGGDALAADGENVTFQDFHIVGKDLRALNTDEKRVFDISKLERFGSLISFRSDDFNGDKVGGAIKNVVVENGHDLVTVTGATVLVEGSIFKNSANSLISVQTKNNGGTKLTLKNNVFINAVVSAVLSWGYTKATGYLDLTIEGFMDVYNWKDSKTAKIMPSSESMASMVNGLVSSELEKKKNEVYMYKIADKKYMHIAIIILATTGLKENNAKINGEVMNDKAGNSSYTVPSTDNFVLRKLPGASLANTALVVGYGNNNECRNIHISPSTKLNLDKIYEQLKFGR